MRHTAIEGLWKEAKEVDFSSEISQLKIPVTLFVGRNKSAEIPSDISDETLRLYKKEIPSFQVIEFSNLDI